MNQHASGSFEVKINPQVDIDVGDPSIGRMSIVKRFHGDLDATSRGQMLAAHGDAEGSAGYVAMERVTGSLHGRQGSFVLQHSGTMTRGAPQLLVTVVPDSGSGELLGLIGTLLINVLDGQHVYEFDYMLAETPA